MTARAETGPVETTSASRPRRSWWHRNVVGLIAVLVLAPATVLITFQAEWGRYYADRPSVAVEVAPGERAEFGDSGWRVLSTERIRGDSAEPQDAALPPGTDLIIVTTEVDPGALDSDGLSPGCLVALDELESPGGTEERTWGDEASPGMYLAGDSSAASGCDPEITDGYRFESQYLIPSDVDGPLALQIEVISEFPRYLHLAL